MPSFLKIEMTIMTNVQWTGIKVISMANQAYSEGEQKECLGDLNIMI